MPYLFFFLLCFIFAVCFLVMGAGGLEQINCDFKLEWNVYPHV